MKHIVFLISVSLTLFFVPKADAQAYCEVDCGSTDIMCPSNTSSCSATSRDCDDNIRGHVVCDGVIQSCPLSCSSTGGGTGGGLDVTLTCGTIGLETHCAVRTSGGVSCSAPEWTYQGETPNMWLPDGNHAELWLKSNCDPSRINTISVTVACSNGVQTKWKNIQCDNGGGGLSPS